MKNKLFIGVLLMSTLFIVGCFKKPIKIENTKSFRLNYSVGYHMNGDYNYEIIVENDKYIASYKKDGVDPEDALKKEVDIEFVHKIEDIMTSLRIFNNLQWPIRMIPGLINNFNEVAISMKRIQKYLFQDEINPGNVIKKDKYMDLNNLSIKIENGNYSWGVPPTSLAEIKMQDLKSRGISLDMKRDGKHFGRKKEKRRNPSSSPIELSTEINKGQDYTKFTDEISTDDSNISTSSEKEEKKDKLFEKVENMDLEGGLGISDNNQGKKKHNKK